LKGKISVKLGMNVGVDLDEAFISTESWRNLELTEKSKKGALERILCHFSNKNHLAFQSFVLVASPAVFAFSCWPRKWDLPNFISIMSEINNSNRIKDYHHIQFYVSNALQVSMKFSFKFIKNYFRPLFGIASTLALKFSPDVKPHITTK
jgi:hypothetical protein